MIEVTDRVPGERAPLTVKGRRTDDNSIVTLVVIHEDNGTWAIHGLGNPGARLPTADEAYPAASGPTSPVPRPCSS